MKTRPWAISTLVSIVLSLFASQDAYATWSPYDWIITVETEVVAKPAKNSDAGLTPIVKANIRYSSVAKGDSTDYENIWFCKGRTFGIERHAPLSLGRGRAAAIRVLHKGPILSSADVKAAAKSIVRVMLDLRLSGNLLQTVIVEDDSFFSIRDELTNEGFERFVIPEGAPFHLAAALFLQNESANRNQFFYYVPRHVHS